MLELQTTHEETLALYVSMPDQLEAALAGLSELDLDLARGTDAWTIREIIHHVVDGDDLTNTIIKAALGKTGCTFDLEWYDSNNAWADTLDYASRLIEPSVALFRASHRHIEQLLCHLPDAWERHVTLKRTAGHGEVDLTVGQLIDHQTKHALHHIEQIRATRDVHKM